MRMPDSCPTKKVFDSDPRIRHEAQGSTTISMAGSGEARSDGDRVSAWMGGYSQGIPIILENCSSTGHASHIDVLYLELANNQEFKPLDTYQYS